MANTISTLSYANTFGDWVVLTDAIATEVNSIGKYNWTKDSGQLILNGSGNALQVANNVLIQGQLQTQGIGTFAANVSVGNQLLLTNTSTSLIASGQATVAGTINATNTGVGLAVTNNTTMGGYLSVAGNTNISNTLTVTGTTTISNSIVVTGNTNIYGNVAVTAIQANSSINTAAITVVNGVTVAGLNVVPFAASSYTTANAGFAQANAAYNQSNTATTTGQAAFDQANTGFTKANAAYNQANTATTTAQAGFNQANTATNTAQAGFNQANNAFGQANVAFNQANNAFGQANVAFNRANASYNQANVATTTGQAAFDRANSSYNTANAGYDQANSATNTASAGFNRANASFDQANISYNLANSVVNGTQSITGSTFNFTGTTFNATAAVGNFSSITTTGGVTVGGNFTINGSTVYNSNNFILSANATTATNNYVTVNRGSSGSNAALRWNESGQYWDMNNVGSGTYYQIMNVAMIADSTTSTSTATVPTNRILTGAYATANLAYDQANAATTNASAGFTRANAAFTQANAAYNYANTQIALNNGVNNTQNTWISSNALITQIAFNTANVGYALVNAGGTIAGPLTVSGNLIVNGTTSFINVATLQTAESLIELAGNNTTDSIDIGFYGQYVSSGTKYAGLVRSAGSNFYLFKDIATNPTSNSVGSITLPNFGTLNANLTGGVISGLAAPVPIGSGGTNSTSYTNNTLTFFNGTSLVSLANVSSAGSYGSASQVATHTVDGFGRITASSNVPIAISSSAVSGLAASATTDTTNASNITSGTFNTFLLPTSGATAGTYGGAAVSPVVTVDNKGRVTFIANTTTSIDASNITSGTLSVARGGTGAGSLTGVVKGNGTGAFTAAIAGTDYAPATSGSSILSANGQGGFSSVTVGSGLSFSGGTLSSSATGSTYTLIASGSFNTSFAYMQLTDISNTYDAIKVVITNGACAIGTNTGFTFRFNFDHPTAGTNYATQDLSFVSSGGTISGEVIAFNKRTNVPFATPAFSSSGYSSGGSTGSQSLNSSGLSTMSVSQDVAIANVSNLYITSYYGNNFAGGTYAIYGIKLG